VLSWQVGPYLFHEDGVLRLGAVLTPLSPLQRKLLLCFVRHPGQLVERRQLLMEGWGHTRVSPVSLARAVHGLRQILDKGPLGGRVIGTTYGSGYVFSAPVRLLAPNNAQNSGGVAAPSRLALAYYLEARVAARQGDPLQLTRAQTLLDRALQSSPTFVEAILFQCFLQLDRCRWGLQTSLTTGSHVETLLRQAEQHQAPAEDLFALRAETLSLLHWQAAVVDDTYGGWLPAQLGYGVPLLSWVRHLLATGRGEEGLRLLEPHLDGHLPMGWTLAAQITFHRGEPNAAIEMVRGQLGFDGWSLHSHLFLAILHAHLGQRAAALRSLEDCGGPIPSFQGCQSVVAYVLARIGEGARAETLLRHAPQPGDAAPGLPSFWALSALQLGHHDLAGRLFHQALDQRCYHSPFVAGSPLLEPFQGLAVVQSFRQRIADSFPTPAPAEDADPVSSPPASRRAASTS
jgi:DNA-binding winged helix-turn-helix (wHTH) protein